MKLVAARLPNITWLAPWRQVPVIKTRTISDFGFPIGNTCVTVGRDDDVQRPVGGGGGGGTPTFPSEAIDRPVAKTVLASSRPSADHDPSVPC